LFSILDNLFEILHELIGKGITLSHKQAEIIKRDYGVEIPPYIIAECSEIQKQIDYFIESEDEMNEQG
jgi:hypothetical protein